MLHNKEKVTQEQRAQRSQEDIFDPTLYPLTKPKGVRG